jgi:hypothetical protein
MSDHIEQVRAQEGMSSAPPRGDFPTIEVPRDIAEREFGAEVMTEEQDDE